MKNYLMSAAVGDIAGPMAYACYREMPDSLVYAALKKLPDWMVDVNERFDEAVNR